MKLNEFYAAVDGNYEDAMERLQNEMFVGKFLRMLPRDGSMMLLEKAMADGRANDAFRAAHTLKGIALNLSLTKLAAACSQLTEALRGADTIPQQARELMRRRGACPTAHSAVWRSCVHWPPARSCCCWTSLLPV